MAKKPAQRRTALAGFIMIETLVALAIVTTGIMAAVVALSTANRATDQATEGATSAWLLTSQVELIKSSPFVAPPGVYPTVVPPDGFTVDNSTAALSGGNSFIQDVTVNVYRNGELVESIQMLKVDAS